MEKRVYLIWPADISKQSALYPPLGIASLAGVMEEKNYKVDVLDLSFDEDWKRLHALKKEGGIYGISFTSSLYSNTKRCINIIRNKDKRAKIILGGPHASVLPEETLGDLDADIVCIGESEASFPLTVEALQNDEPLNRIKGIAFKDVNGRIVINPSLEIIQELDSLPFPDQSLFPYEQYFKEKGFRELSIITSRGCPGQCTFCQPAIEKMFGRKIRFHSSDYIIDQIKELIRKYKLDFFVISDDTFVTNKKRVMEFCQRIVGEKINIFWRCQTRITLLDRDILRAMKRAGCFVVALGVESGNQGILDNLHKKIDVQQIKDVFKLCHEEGMLTHAYLMIGSPGESPKTIDQTVSLLKEIKPLSSNICVTTPYPGTYLYDILKKDKLLEENAWDSFDHLLSDTVHIRLPGIDIAQLNEFKKQLIKAQRYPLFKMKCLWKAFMNRDTLQKLISVVGSNPGLLYRGLRLFFKSIYHRGLDLSNPKTKAYRIYSEPP